MILVFIGEAPLPASVPIVINNLREFVLNSRHLDPRRVWMGGSGLRALRHFRVSVISVICVILNSGTSIFDNPSVTLEPCRAESRTTIEKKKLPKLKKSLLV